jgi:hypothetical protein
VQNQVLYFATVAMCLEDKKGFPLFAYIFASFLRHFCARCITLE